MPGPTSSATGQSAPRAWAPSSVAKPFPPPHLQVRREFGRERSTSSSSSAYPWLPAPMEMSPGITVRDAATTGLGTRPPLSPDLPHFSVSVQGGSMARHCPLLSLGVLVPTGKLCTGPTCPTGPRTNSNWASWHEIVSGSLASGRAGFRSLVSGPTGYVTLCESCTIPAPGFLVCATEIRSSF